MKPQLLTLALLIAAGAHAQERQKITPLYNESYPVETLNGTWKFKLITGELAHSADPDGWLSYYPEQWAQWKKTAPTEIGADSVFRRADFDASRWADIKVPCPWDMQGFAKPHYGTSAAALGLYVRDFTLPRAFAGKKVFLRLDGVMTGYTIYINGRCAGSWRSAYNAASFDITSLVRPGQNRIALETTTRSLGAVLDVCDNWGLSGIFRDVELFATPQTHIDTYKVETPLTDNYTRAAVVAKASIAMPAGATPRGLTLQAALYAPDGRPSGTAAAKVSGGKAELGIPVSRPQLWTAETPALYRLHLRLMQGRKELQAFDQAVGIREIKAEDGVLTVNGQPVKLRGANYHNIAPDLGKTMTREQLLRDLTLMKRANINYVRCSHYAPDRKELALTDSMGFYVCDELSYVFGDDRMSDPEYINVLCERAEAMILRDQNHPSVFMWDIGNENDISKPLIFAARLAKRLDPTRLITFAGTYGQDNIPDVADVYCPHYPRPQSIPAFEKGQKRPVIFTEYNHALGLSEGWMDDLWPAIFRCKHTAGGAIWHFKDQGLLLRNQTPVDTTRLTEEVWLDPTTCYKTTDEGADGIVYSDGTPQTDFYQVRLIYSPVQVIEREAETAGGKVRLTVYNQYDFTDLSALKGRYSLCRNGRPQAEGTLTVKCAPHDTVSIEVPCQAPKSGGDIWTLQLAFADAERDIYEHTVRLNGCRVQLPAPKPAGQVGSAPLRSLCPQIETGLLARAGREPIMADDVIERRVRPYTNDKNYFWRPWLLEPSKVETKEAAPDSPATLSTHCVYPRSSSPLFADESIEGDISYTALGEGQLSVDFDLRPVNATGVLLNAGVSFIMDPSVSRIQWVGDGPYSWAPDKRGLAQFGIHSLHRDDLHFNGDRHAVELMTITDADGNGVALIVDRADIALERKNGRVVVSFNSLVSGLGAKKDVPDQVYKARDVKHIKGSFRLLSLKAGQWPKEIESLVGLPDKTRKPYAPFYYSYDSSK